MLKEGIIIPGLEKLRLQPVSPFTDIRTLFVWALVASRRGSIGGGGWRTLVGVLFGMGFCFALGRT